MERKAIISDIILLIFFVINFMLGGIYFYSFKSFYIVLIVGFFEFLFVLLFYALMLIKEERDE